MGEGESKNNCGKIRAVCVIIVVVVVVVPLLHVRVHGCVTYCDESSES